MRAITFTLELREPLLATALEGDPNSAVSLGYVPGSVLRGALIACYLQDPANSTPFEPDEAKVRALFFDGTVRYLNAYPLACISDDLEARTLPVPLSWHVSKNTSEPQGANQSARVFDLCWESPEVAFGDQQSKLLSKPFFYFTETPVFIDIALEDVDAFDDEVDSENSEDTLPPGIVLITAERRLAVHTQRERHKGRAIEDDGAVFRYESVSSGARFGGLIVFDDGRQDVIDKLKLVDVLHHLLQSGGVSLGGSRTAGYGQAKISDIRLPDTHPLNKNWRETRPVGDISADSEFTITLLSNAVIRDENGQYQADLPYELVTQKLGRIEIAHRDFNGIFKRMEIVGGFNRKWGLPLQQIISLKAGSVFTFVAKQDIPSAQLQRLISDGIGDRRVEGFGRVAVNLNLIAELRWLAGESRKRAVASPITEAVSRALADRMLGRILRQRLDAILIDRAGRYTVENAPPNSQLARLRAVLRSALRLGDPQPVTSFFVSTRRIAHRHFMFARILADGKVIGYLQDWIEATLKDQNQFTPNVPSLGDGNSGLQASFDAGLKLEYHLRLIDSILARATREGHRSSISSTR